MINYQPYHEHLEFFNSKHREQDYYTVKQIIKITGVSERTVRARITKLKIEYLGMPNMMIKGEKGWRISKLIVDKFYSKYKPQKTTRYNQKWQSFITWVMRDNYDDNAHNYLIKKVKESFPDQHVDRNWCFVIEKTKRGVNHVHGLSLLNHEELFDKIYQVIRDSGIPENEYDVLVGEVYNRHCAERYLRK
jgi:hypothetical protein